MVRGDFVAAADVDVRAADGTSIHGSLSGEEVRLDLREVTGTLSAAESLETANRAGGPLLNTGLIDTPTILRGYDNPEAPLINEGEIRIRSATPRGSELVSILYR